MNPNEITTYTLPVNGLEVRTASSLIRIQSEDGRELFAIHGDGTVVGEIEDATEAAAIFVREVRRLFASATRTAPTYN